MEPENIWKYPKVEFFQDPFSPCWISLRPWGLWSPSDVAAVPQKRSVSCFYVDVTSGRFPENLPPRTAQAQGFASLSWTSRFSLAEASREEPPSLLPKKILGSRNGHSNSESRLEKLQIFCLQLQLHQGLCVLWCMLPFLGTWMVDNVTFRSEMGVKTYAKSPSSIVFAKTIRNSPEYVGPTQPYVLPDGHKEGLEYLFVGKARYPFWHLETYSFTLWLFNIAMGKEKNMFNC